jgi:hypothetical protein
MDKAMSRAGAMKRTCTTLALRRHKGSLLADRRGAVAFEMLWVFSFMLFSLLFPAADLAVAGFQYISALEALRGFGEYVQYNPPSDVTSPSTWWTGLNKTVGAYTISPVNGGVICGETGQACATGNLASPKYYTYTTTVTLTPMVLKKWLCPTSCTYTLSYSERFQ